MLTSGKHFQMNLHKYEPMLLTNYRACNIQSACVLIYIYRIYSHSRNSEFWNREMLTVIMRCFFKFADFDAP